MWGNNGRSLGAVFEIACYLRLLACGRALDFPIYNAFLPKQFQDGKGNFYRLTYKIRREIIKAAPCTGCGRKHLSARHPILALWSRSSGCTAHVSSRSLPPMDALSQDTERLHVRPPKSSLRFVQVQQWVDDLLVESSSEIRILPAGIEQVKGRRSEADAHYFAIVGQKLHFHTLEPFNGVS